MITIKSQPGIPPKVDQLAMKSSEQFPLEKKVHVDEFEIETLQAKEQGRSESDKKVCIVIAIERRNHISQFN